MKINKELQIKIRGWIDYLSENFIDLSGDSEILYEEDYDKLSDEIEIDDICFSFPDDQEHYYISIEDFISYMTEIESLRREDDSIVRTDHIIQAVISSGRMGYANFDDKLQTVAFRGEGIDVSIVKSPFLVGVMNAKEGKYEEDFGLGACEPYTAIEIRPSRDLDDKTINKLIERICFYLTDKFGVEIYPWEGPDISELYNRMDEYYNEDEEKDEEEEEETNVIDIDRLPSYSPLLRMFRQAKGVGDPEIQFLQYYKILEYVSPLVAKSVAYDRLNRRLDLLPSVDRDAKYLDSILVIAKKYDTDMRDDSLAIAVIENCVDVIPLFGLLPEKQRKTIKHNLNIQKDSITDADVTDEQIRGLQKQIAMILYATRNSIVHAKSNYIATGNEISQSDLPAGNEMMEIITRSIINWNQRQPEGFRS